ncbi:hypothetical protein QFC21_006920 [Naganishia friedmannii]|uniref:Uncharacterized protein n=1 Tax=Naganishia friedmannii TaxID=89922 RepID=A0ACC2UZM3_9TREE|nr:hypothetical protein QFC21_006920 [Naganishia friedmannii]
MRAKHLPADIATRAVAVADINRIAKRVLKMVLKYHAAIQGTVVLKNDDEILPLRNVRRLLAVGRLATSTQTGDNGSSTVHGDKNIVTPLQGLQQQEGVIATHVDGTDLAAVAEACPMWMRCLCLVDIRVRMKVKLVTVMFLVKVKSTLRLGGDGSTLRLTKANEEMITEVCHVAAEKMILGLEVSGPVILPEHIRSNAAAIIVTGYGGCEFGNALREVLFGDAEPSGRLACSIPQAETDIADIDLQTDTAAYGRFCGYRLLQQNKRKTAYPFNRIRNKLDQRFFNVVVSLRNFGDYDTTHVVQIYASAGNGKADHDYERALVGFVCINKLQVGGERSCIVNCRMDPVYHYNTETREFDVAQGDYNLIASSYEGDEKGLTTVAEASQFSWSARVKKVQ